MKRILLVAVAAAALGGTAQAKELKSIGISLGSMGNPFFVALARGAEAEAKKINPNAKVTAVGYDYDLNKQFTQIDNVKGTTSGIVPDRPGSGTYHVNEDCTGVTGFVPGPGILVRERIVIVDDGNEIRGMVEFPPAVSITGPGARRIHTR